MPNPDHNPRERDPNEGWLELGKNIPHSGSSEVPENMREYPSELFDNTPLEQVAYDGILTPPEDTSTLPHNLPQITEELNTSLGESKNFDKPWHKRLSTKVAAGAIAGAAILGVYQLSNTQEHEVPLAATDETEENEELGSNNSNDVVDSDNTSGEAGGEGITETPELGLDVEETPYPTLESPEIINESNEPVLLTANDPEELAFQIVQSRAAAENASNPPDELAAIHALFGDTDRSSHITSEYKNHVRTIKEYTRGIREGRESRGEPPYYIQYGIGNVTSQSPDENTMILQVNERRDYSPVNHPENNVAFLREYRLEKTTTDEENIGYLGRGQSIWIIRHTNPISEFEVE